MAELEWNFEHKFSKLGNLQDEMLLHYQAKVQDDAVEISVIKYQNGDTVCKQKSLQGVSAEEGRQIAAFLYENAVPMETWEEVLEEVFCRIKAE